MYYWKKYKSLYSYLRWLDGDATFLLIFPRVSETGLSSAGRGDDTSLWHKRVGQSWLSVIYVRNHRHVADVGLLVHDGTDLVDCKVHLRWCDERKKNHTHTQWVKSNVNDRSTPTWSRVTSDSSCHCNITTSTTWQRCWSYRHKQWQGVGFLLSPLLWRFSNIDMTLAISKIIPKGIYHVRRH